MDVSKAKAIVTRKREDDPELKAARLHVNAKLWHTLRKLCEYVRLVFPSCREYSSTDTSVSFEFTEDIATSDVESAMVAYSRWIRGRTPVRDSGCGFHIDAAPPTPDYTPK